MSRKIRVILFAALLVSVICALGAVQISANEPLCVQHVISLEKTSVKEATCVAAGYTGDYVCEHCGEVIIKGTVIPYRAHEAGEWVTTADPTCQVTGTQEQRCKTCDLLMGTQTLEIIDHIPGDWEYTTVPTCTAGGEREKRCTMCNLLEASESVDALGHVGGSYTVTTAATCKQAGVETEYCVLCNTKLSTRDIEKTAHIEDRPTGKQATCAEAGQLEYNCLVCGEFIRTEEVPALEHLYENETVVAPTYYKEGKGAQVCALCGETGREFTMGVVPPSNILITATVFLYHVFLWIKGLFIV